MTIHINLSVLFILLILTPLSLQARFTQPDIWPGHMADPITLNKYLYGKSDSVNHIDPSGHMSIGNVSAGSSIQGVVPSISTQTFQVSIRRIGKKFACIAIEEIVTDAIMQQLTGGVYFLQTQEGSYVGKTNDFERRLQEHIRNRKLKISRTLTRFHMELDRNDMRIIEQFFMELFEPESNRINSVARNPASANSKMLRGVIDRIDFCD